MITRSRGARSPLLLGAIGAVVIGGIVAARRRVRTEDVGQLGPSTATRKEGRFARFMERLPADSPPKLVATILPRLREQNDEIITLLRQQNELLRRGQTEPVIR